MQMFLFAALIRNNKTTELLFKDSFHLFAPEYLLEEFSKYKTEILIKSNRSNEEFNGVMDILKKRISFIPYDDFNRYIEKANRITPDPNDVEYIALAMSIKASLWSNDKDLKGIQGVMVYSTSELIELLIG